MPPGGVKSTVDNHNSGHGCVSDSQSIPMHSRLSDACARLILATRLIDKVFRAIDRARSMMVVALASDEVLARFNCLAYGRADSAAFRSYLFLWEERLSRNTSRHRPPDC